MVKTMDKSNLYVYDVDKISPANGFDIGDYRILVWNPTMRQHLTLPKPNSCSSINVAVLGYGLVDNENKVLCASQTIIYTLGPQDSLSVNENE